MDRPTFGPLVRERTASVIWEMLEQIEEHVFLWNIFPLHPFPEGNVYGNRPHSAVERNAGEELLVSLVSILKPRRIVAVGNDSARALMKIFSKLDINHVRHPSYGGERVFREQVASLYGLEHPLPGSFLTCLTMSKFTERQLLSVQLIREHHKSQYRCRKDFYLDKSNVDKVQVVCLSLTASELMQLAIYLLLQISLGVQK